MIYAYPKELPDNIGLSISANEHVCSMIYFCSYCVCLSECLILQARADDQAIYIIKPSQIFAPDLPNHSLPDSVNLPSARGTRQSPICTRQRLCRVLHSAKSTRQKKSRQRRLCRVSFVGHSAKPLPSADTRQSWNRKKSRKNGNFYPKKMKFFLIGGGPHRSAPIHLRLFSRKFHSYAADGIRTRDLPLRTNLLYHYTTLSLVCGFRFSSQ